MRGVVVVGGASFYNVAVTTLPTPTYADPPPRRRDRLISWLVLAGCLALASGPVFVELARPPVVGEAEATALDTARQTRRRQTQFAHEPWSWDRVTPSRDGLAQPADPPGRTWLLAVAMATLEEPARPEEVAARARLMTGGFALLTVAGAYWAGMAIGGLVTASMSGLICLGMPGLMMQGRSASGESIALGFSTLAIAAALWAIRPLRPAATLTRQAIGWSLCGVALGAGALVSGAEVVTTILVPVLAMLLLAPHRVGHVMGLVAAVLIAVLMVTPWAGHVHLRQPDAWMTWMAPLLPRPGEQLGDVLRAAGSRAVMLLVLVSPWSLWLAAAVVQPFSTSSEGSRNRMFLGWTWFWVVTGPAMFQPGEASVRDVLASVVAASVMMGQLFRNGADLSAAGRHARFWRWLRWPQWGLLLGMSGTAALGGLFQPALVERGWVSGPVVAPMHGLYWAGLATVGVGVLVVSLRAILHHYPARAVVSWSVWSAVMSGLLAIPLARGAQRRHHGAADAGRAIAAMTGDRPVIYLTDRPPPDAAARFHADRLFAPLTTAQLERLTSHRLDEGPIYLLTTDADAPPPPWEPVRMFDAPRLGLWYSPSPSGRETPP